jgi:hypothetical protein
VKRARYTNFTYRAILWYGTESAREIEEQGSFVHNIPYWGSPYLPEANIKHRLKKNFSKRCRIPTRILSITIHKGPA